MGRQKQAYVGARDIFGIKPFYLLPRPDGSGPVFGSEIKAFSSIPRQGRQRECVAPIHAAVFRHRGNLQGRALPRPTFCV
ncbi:MAG: hypothetical protein ACLR7U_03490 [Ruthenibacterium lactatiformans]